MPQRLRLHTLVVVLSLSLLVLLAAAKDKRGDNHDELGDNGVDVYLGQIQLFPYDFTPSGWALCAGQLLPIAQNQALFDLLGTTFGGDGETTFGLPDLRGQEPIPNLRYFIALDGIFPSQD